MKNNKGFSLVELIIVIAIMAILVGVLAPQLIKYLEKTNVSSDVQFCDAIHTAIITALSDPEVVTSKNADVRTMVGWYSSQNLNSPLIITAYSSNAFIDSVKDTMGGFDPFHDDPKPYFKSTPAKQSGELYIRSTDAGNSFIIYINHSDNSGKKGDYTGSDMDKVICAPRYDN